MGNYQSQLDNSSEIPFHPSLLQPHVFRHKDQNFMTIRISSSREQFDKWVKEKNIFKHMIKNNRHLFWVKGAKFQKIGIFGDTGYSVLTFLYCPVTLKQEIINRSKANVSFKQKKLWYLLYSLVELAQQVHKYSQVIGDIRPLNILLTQKGQINVLTKQSLPKQTHNIQKTLKTMTPTFLAPEQSEILHKNSQQKPKLSPVSESFSIGLTVLMASILRLGEEIYSSSKNFQKDILKQYIRQLQEQTTYEENFKFIIKGLCEINPNKRFTTSQVFKCLKQYEHNIYSLTPFYIAEFPQKMLKKQQSLKSRLQNFDEISFSGNNISPSQKLFKTFEQNENLQQKTNKLQKTVQIKPHYLSKQQHMKIIQSTKSLPISNEEPITEPHLIQISPYKKMQSQVETPTLKYYMNPQTRNGKKFLHSNSKDYQQNKKQITNQYNKLSQSERSQKILKKIQNGQSIVRQIDFRSENSLKLLQSLNGLKQKSNKMTPQKKMVNFDLSESRQVIVNEQSPIKKIDDHIPYTSTTFCSQRFDIRNMKYSDWNESERDLQINLDRMKRSINLSNCSMQKNI